MTARKNLGMGLDLLLNASNNRNFPNTGKTDLAKATSIFEKAVQEEEKANLFEAYYQYRKLIDYLEGNPCIDNNDLSRLISEAMNNLAILLYENGQADAACSYLKQAADICPENQVAMENLEIILEGE
jgi:tetratricopeptide (TPR) repeat protein